ncbi:MAG: hypothetical protein AAGE65_05870 [Planctomycetota bacterium]
MTAGANATPGTACGHPEAPSPLPASNARRHDEFQTVLSLDPPSTSTGYAVLRPDATVVEAGLLRLPGKRPALARIDAMVADLFELFAGVAQPAVGVIEVPSGKVHRGRHGGGGAGLSVYGLAAGALREALRRLVAPERLVSVTAEQWTRGKRKSVRTQLLGAELPAYGAVAARDGGGDVGDAIAMGRWWLEQREEVRSG